MHNPKSKTISAPIVLISSTILLSTIFIAPSFSTEPLTEDGQSSNKPIAATADLDFGPYMADLQRRIKRAWFPPRGNETRKVTVIFKVHADGKVSDIKLDKSSGVEPADAAALSAITNASPFRMLPAGAPKVVDIQFTFDYNVFSKAKEQSAHAQSPRDITVEKESKKEVDKAYSWLPFALGGALLALLIMYISNLRQNTEIDIAGGKDPGKNR